MHYNLDLVKIMARDLAATNADFYKRNNIPGSLVEVPYNHYFHEPKLFESYCARMVSLSPMGEATGKKIYIIDDYNLGASIMGGYVEIGNNYYIVINGKQNTCWKRFTLIKELCSLYVNQDARVPEMGLKTFDDYQKSLDISYDEMLKLKSRTAGEDLESDTFAIILATELMIPPFYRMETSTLINRQKNSTITMNDIAKSLSMPEFILEKHIEAGFYELCCEYYLEHAVN